jgi:hypothetical protein
MKYKVIAVNTSIVEFEISVERKNDFVKVNAPDGVKYIIVPGAKPGRYSLITPQGSLGQGLQYVQDQKHQKLPFVDMEKTSVQELKARRPDGFYVKSVGTATILSMAGLILNFNIEGASGLTAMIGGVTAFSALLSGKAFAAANQVDRIARNYLFYLAGKRHRRFEDGL